jgi:hypothetical protein
VTLISNSGRFGRIFRTLDVRLHERQLRKFSRGGFQVSEKISRNGGKVGFSPVRRPLRRTTPFRLLAGVASTRAAQNCAFPVSRSNGQAAAIADKTFRRTSWHAIVDADGRTSPEFFSEADGGAKHRGKYLLFAQTPPFCLSRHATLCQGRVALLTHDSLRHRTAPISIHDVSNHVIECRYALLHHLTPVSAKQGRE